MELDQSSGLIDDSTMKHPKLLPPASSPLLGEHKNNMSVKEALNLNRWMCGLRIINFVVFKK